MRCFKKFLHLFVIEPGLELECGLQSLSSIPWGWLPLHGSEVSEDRVSISQRLVLIRLVLRSAPPCVSPGPCSRAYLYWSMSAHLQGPPSGFLVSDNPPQPGCSHLPLPSSELTRMPIFSFTYFSVCFQDLLLYSFPYLTSSELTTVICMTTMEAIHISTPLC